MKWTILETERLRLRWFDAGDAAFIEGLVNEPSWLEFIGDRAVHSEADARALIDKFVAAYRRDGFGLWAIERREDDVVVGMCGLVRRASLPGPDVGYALPPRFWGHGYAREAAAACLAYADRKLGLPRVLAITSPDNVRSMHLLERIGMREERRAILGEDERESVVFAWDAPPGPRDDRARIDALVARFFAAFVNRGGAIPAVAAMPHYFAQGAIIAKADGDRVVTSSVREFMDPRAELLTSGRLVDFSESEIDSRTEIAARFAQRWSTYERSGTLDGKPFADTGTKAMTLVETADGWKILALAW